MSVELLKTISALQGNESVVPLMINESNYRDWISVNLDQIESGLRLVDTEFGLTHPGIARGSIDILARDHYGLYVVIEIKKSNSTAREAVHELIKYTRLLRETEGLGNEDVRCMLLSTEWWELDGVIADFQSMTDFHIGFYDIRVTPDRKRLDISLHNPVLTGVRLEVFFLRTICLNISEERRQILLVQLRHALDLAGITSAAILSLNYRGNNPNVYLRYGLYLVIAEVSSATQLRITKSICEELEITPEEIDTTSYEDYVYAEVTNQCLGMIDEITMRSVDDLPGMLAAWEVDRVHRIGRLGANRKVSSDAELVEMLHQKSAIAQISYSTITSPKLKASWREAVGKVLQCVQNIRVWEYAVQAFLHSIEQKTPEAEVSIHVYCPCDIMMAMFQLVGKNDPRYVPALSIMSQAAGTRSVLTGVIVWDGVTYPESPDSVILTVCESDWSAYHLVRNFPDYEERVAKEHGLSYAVAEWTLSDIAHGHWIELSEGVLQKVPIDSALFKPFQEFLKHNSEYLKRLVDCFEDTVYFG